MLHKRFIYVINVLVLLLLSKVRHQFHAERSFFVLVRRLLHILGSSFFSDVRRFSLSFTSLYTFFTSSSTFNCL